MPVLISMLRAVNVGPHNRIKMDALLALYQSLKLRDAVTFIQSGNVIFRTDQRDTAAVAEIIRKGMEKKCGIRCGVMVRTTAELRAAIKKNPFAGRKGLEPKKLLVTFLAAAPEREACARALAIPAAPEELHIHGREMFVYYANGMARPKLSLASLERLLKTTGTGRNWNSVTKMLEIAERMEAEG